MKKIDKNNIEDILALTPIQEGMLFHYLKDPGSDLHFEQLSLDITGKIDFHLLEQAWNRVIENNEMLRTLFRWEKMKAPSQIVLKQHGLKPTYIDLADKKSIQKQNALEQVKKNDQKEKFDLTGVPFRVTLVKLEENKYVMIVSNHHILYDGWSNGIILAEFFQVYNGLCLGEAALDLPVKTKFKEFVKWLQNQGTNEQEDFWKGYLQGFDPCDPLPMKKIGKKKITGPGIYHMRLGEERTRRIKDFVKKNKITLAAYIYTCWGILLQQYNNSRDVTFDTTISTRPAVIKGIENMVGLFINTLPLRIKSQGEENILTCLKQTYRHLQEREKYKTLSTGVINEYLEEAKKYLFFDTLLVIENYPLDKIFLQNKGNLTVDSYSIVGMTQYDLTVLFTFFEHIEARITYNQTLFDRESISKLCDHFVLILDEILNQPGKRVHEIAVVPEEDRKSFFRYINQRQTPEKNRIAAEYTAPGDPVEEKLAAIWSKVLRVDQSTVSVNENFFNFGGHSLKAALLVANIHKQLNVKMPLAQIFKSPTIKTMAQYIKGAVRDRFESIPSTAEKEQYELSSAQKRLYFLQQMDENNTGYNMPSALVCEGTLDVTVLENVFKQLIRRHESLMTSFHPGDGAPVQKIHKEVKFGIECYREEAKNEHACIIKNFIRPFDLSRAPLLRVVLIDALANSNPHQRESPVSRYILVVDMHHIISDGSSLGILWEEFMTLYTSVYSKSGAGKALPVLRLQYKDYSEWQYRGKKTEALRKQEQFWLKQFETGVPELNLPADFPRPEVQDFSGASQGFRINSEDTRELKKLAIEQEATLYMVLLAIFNIFLAKISGQEDIVIGTPAAGRQHADLERIIGMFVNSIALRNYPRGHKSFVRFLGRVKERTLAAFDNQDYQFEDLVEKLVVKRDLSHHPLFDVAFSFQNMDIQSIALAIPGLDTEMELPGLKLKPYQYENRVSKLDLNLVGYETEKELHFIFEYRTKLFKKETIELMIDSFMVLVKSVIHDVHGEIQHLDCKTAFEKELNKIENIEFKL
jgi:non-ribosomal peptide synthetase component F